MATSARWFGNSVHGATASAGDRVTQVRNRALYRNTMNIAAQGGLKAVRGRAPLSARPQSENYYEPAVLLNGEYVNPPSEGDNGCVGYYVRSSRSYQHLLQLTQGMYEGRAQRTAQGAVARPVPASGTTNGDTVRSTSASNPTSGSNRYNYLTLNDAGGPTELLAASAPNAQNAAYDAARQTPIDPARCMQYPPNPRISITYGGGGCYAAP